jgi:thiol-disulfide isomerase/thioredoxin
VYLFETEGRDYFVMDSAKVEGNGFKWRNLEVEAGIYKLGFSDKPNELLDIILSSVNDSVSFVFANRDLRRSFQSTNSEETTAWREYLKTKGQHDQYIESIRKSNLSSDEKRKSIYAREADFKKVQSGMAAKAPGSFFAKVMRHLQSDYRFEQHKYWSDLDFKDPSLIHSTVFPDRIEDYMRLHGSKSPDPNDPTKGFYSAVDDIANLIISSGDTRVLEFVLYTMSEGFYSSGMENLSLYVVDNYFYGDACGDQEISELFRMKASGIQNLKVGGTAPDFSIKTSTGQVASLKDVSAKNNLTLVLFWASFCHRCEREIPELKTIYNEKKSKGFEVLAVSVDSNERDFMNGISNAGTSWYNGCDYQSWRGPIVKDYRVTSTPVMFLVNKQREILAKPKSVAELNTLLARLAL